MRSALSKICISLKRNDRLSLVIILLLSFYTHINRFLFFYLSENGLPKTQDSYWYIDHANELLQNFSMIFDFNGIFYIGYYGLLSLFLWVFKTETAMIVMQMLLSIFGAVLVYRIAEILFDKKVALVSGIIYALSHEINFWSMYLLTDSFFLFVLLLSVYFWLQYESTKRRAYLYAFFASLAYMALIRPTGLFIIAFIVLFLIVRLDVRKIFSYVKNKKHILILLALLFAAGIYAAYKMINGPLGMSFYWNLRWLLYSNYSSGQIFDIPTLYDHIYKADKRVNYADNFVISFFINNGIHIFKLYFKRFVSFWGEMWIWHYRVGSIAEGFRYIVDLVPLIFMAAGMLKAIFGKNTERTAILFVPIFATVLFCMIFFIDSAWRYRLPGVPFNGIFMAVALVAFADRIMKTEFFSSIIKKVKTLPFHR